MAWCPRASHSVPHTEGSIAKLQLHITASALCAGLQQVADLTVRGGGVPARPYGFHAVFENGSAASELRCRCAYCIMVRVSAHRIQGCGHEYSWQQTRAPLDSSSRPPHVCRRARSRQGCAFGGADAPSLTAPARAGSPRSGGSGRGNGLFQIEQGNSRDDAKQNSF
jgi:hypothetical protein